MAHVLMFDWKGDHFPFSLKKKKSIFKWGLYPLLLKSHVFFTRPHWAERGLVPIPLVLLRVWWRMWSDSPCCLLVTPPPSGNICRQAKTIWELCFKELRVSTSGHKQLVLVSVETWFEAVEKHIRGCLKFYKNWSWVCLLGLSNTLLLGFRFLSVIGTPGKGPGRPQILMQGVCPCVQEHILVGSVANLRHKHVDSEGPSLCIGIERCFLFHCPFRIILASKIGLWNKRVSSKIRFRLPVWRRSVQPGRTVRSSAPEISGLHVTVQCSCH